VTDIELASNIIIEVHKDTPRAWVNVYSVADPVSTTFFWIQER
jgi:hypothetical protein